MFSLSAQDTHIVGVWIIALTSIALVLIRPRGWPEAIWAVLGACLLIVCRLISLQDAARGAIKGTDVYLFLSGMMVISELARRAGVFDWIAMHAVAVSRGSPTRLFLLVYAVGTAVTVFLSNDATAVVLTPAVLAAVRTAQADPLPFIFVCAFIANAASFVLPISNPANLVVYDGDMPPLKAWLATFSLASIASIAITFIILRRLTAKRLRNPVSTDVNAAPLGPDGKMALYAIAFLAVVLMVSSALKQNLGAPACAVGLVVALAIGFRDRAAWKNVFTGVPWSVLPLVAGLFVLVEAIDRVGALHYAVRALSYMRNWRPVAANLTSGFGIAIISNLMNNLPSGLISAAAVKSARVTGDLRNSVLVGVDLGPNLSITGSLATILWLIAIRREGLNVTFWDFLKWGMLVMPPALLLALLTIRD